MTKLKFEHFWCKHLYYTFTWTFSQTKTHYRLHFQNILTKRKMWISWSYVDVLFTTMPQVQQKTKEGHSVPAGTRHAGNHAWRYRPIFTSRGETWLCKTLFTYNIFPYLVSSMYCGLGPIYFYITAVYCVISSCRAFLKHFWKTKQKINKILRRSRQVLPNFHLEIIWSFSVMNRQLICSFIQPQKTAAVMGKESSLYLP